MALIWPRIQEKHLERIGVKATFQFLTNKPRDKDYKHHLAVCFKVSLLYLLGNFIPFRTGSSGEHCSDSRRKPSPRQSCEVCPTYRRRCSYNSEVLLKPSLGYLEVKNFSIGKHPISSKHPLKLWETSLLLARVLFQMPTQPYRHLGPQLLLWNQMQDDTWQNSFEL